MNPINFSPRFGTLEFGVETNRSKSGPKFLYRIGVAVDNWPEDRVTINGEELGTSTIAQELYKGLQDNSLTIELLREKALQLLSNRSLLALSEKASKVCTNAGEVPSGVKPIDYLDHHSTNIQSVFTDPAFQKGGKVNQGADFLNIGEDHSTFSEQKEFLNNIPTTSPTDKFKV